MLLEPEMAVQNFLTAVAADFMIDFGVTTQTWSRRPDFKTVKNKFTRQVFTNDKVYAFVNDGTGRRFIYPKKAQSLSFAQNYKAKTVRRQIRSTGGGKSGRKVMRQFVEHPGNDPREFDEAIIEKWEKEYETIFERMI